MGMANPDRSGKLLVSRSRKRSRPRGSGQVAPSSNHRPIRACLVATLHLLLHKHHFFLAAVKTKENQTSTRLIDMTRINHHVHVAATSLILGPVWLFSTSSAHNFREKNLACMKY